MQIYQAFDCYSFSFQKSRPIILTTSSGSGTFKVQRHLSIRDEKLPRVWGQLGANNYVTMVYIGRQSPTYSSGYSVIQISTPGLQCA